MCWKSTRPISYIPHVVPHLRTPSSFQHIWLVVVTPVKNMSSSVGMMKFPTEWTHKSHVPVTTNQTCSTQSHVSPKSAVRQQRHACRTRWCPAVAAVPAGTLEDAPVKKGLALVKTSFTQIDLVDMYCTHIIYIYNKKNMHTYYYASLSFCLDTYKLISLISCPIAKDMWPTSWSRGPNWTRWSMPLLPRSRDPIWMKPRGQSMGIPGS